MIDFGVLVSWLVFGREVFIPQRRYAPSRSRAMS